MLNKRMPEYDIAVELTQGAIFTVKGYATGDYNGYYGSDVAFSELASDSHRFEGFRADIVREPVQSFWAYTFDIGIGIHGRDADRITEWRDLAGERVFTGPAPWIGHGSPDADWISLNPSPEEVAMLEAADFEVTKVDPIVFGDASEHLEEVIGVRLHYGFHVGLEVPADEVYGMLTTIEANAAELTAADPAFRQIEVDMPGMQRRGVASAVDFVPVHPGLAMYMRERGVWDPAWDARVASP